jgi:hypothetical protein
MRIINNKKLYVADEQKMVKIDNDGWDYYNGQNYQHYSLFYNVALDIVKLITSNNGDCYGDYSTKYFSSAKDFATSYNGNGYKKWRDLLGEIDETNSNILEFINATETK